MVACTYHPILVITWCLTYFWKQLCCSSIYLFFILMKWQPKHSSLLVIAIGFGLLYFNFQKSWLLVPVLIALLGFLINAVGEFLHKGWMLIAKVLGFINSRILLTLLFYVLLTPLALVFRLFNKTRLKHTLKNNTSFVIRNHQYTIQDLRNPW